MSQIDITTFVKHFAEILEETDPSTITAGTIFRDLDEWSSLTSLTLIAMVDEEYQVKLTGNEIKSSETVNDLFDVVKGKVTAN